MSLLAEILQRIRQPEISRQIPPNLKEIVQNSALGRSSRKRILILGGLFLIAIMMGFYVINIITSGIEDEENIGISIDKNIHPQKIDTAGVSTTQRIINRSIKKKQILQASSPVKSVKRQSSVVKNKKKKRINRPATNQRVRDESLYMARKYELLEDYSQALRYYKKALRYDPANPSILNNIAYMYIKLNNPSMANKFAREALKIKSDYIPAMVNLSIGLAMEGEYDMAEEVLQRALRIDEHNRDAILNLAILYERQKRFDTAMEYYSKLADFGDINGNLGMARIYEKRHEYDKARAIYRKLISSQDIDKNTASYVRRRLMLIGNKIYLDGSR
jgi:Tfp pilus assembly protein PilF